MPENLENVFELLVEIKAKLDSPKPEKIVFDLADIAAVFGKEKPTAYNIIKAPNFPKPVYVEGHLGRCWMKEDVVDWARSQQILNERN